MPKICKHENCNNFVFGGGYCKFHQFLRNNKKKEPKKTTRLRPSSEKRRKKSEIYSGLRIDFFRDHSLCEARCVNECTRHATEVHHKKGRIGKNFLDILTWLAVCRNCHSWIETHPKEAKEMGFSQSRLKR